MKVLHVIGCLGKGGDSVAVFTVLKKLKKENSNIKFDFLTHQGCKMDEVEKLRKQGHKVYILNGDVRKLGPVKYYKEIKKILDKTDYDAIHAHTSMQSGIALLAAKKAGIEKRICHSHVTELQRKANILKRIIAMPIFRYLIRKNATTKVACGEAAGEFLFKKDKFKILYNGIDIRRFYNVDMEKIVQIKNDLNIDEAAIIVGQVGSFSNMKNQTFTLKIAELAKKRNKNIVFVFAGEGKRFLELKKMSEEQELPAYFIGKKSDIEKYMHLFDVLVMPSLEGEGLPVSLIEAQCAGCKCLISDKVTKEADMNLGLCRYLNLDEGERIWLEQIENFYDEKVQYPKFTELQRSKFNQEIAVEEWKKIYL